MKTISLGTNCHSISDRIIVNYFEAQTKLLQSQEYIFKYVNKVKKLCLISNKSFSDFTFNAF